MKKLAEIKTFVQLASKQLKGEFKPTNDGVPRIILRYPNIAFSIVYVGRVEKWKVFHPFPAIRQTKQYCNSIAEVKDYCENVVNNG